MKALPLTGIRKLFLEKVLKHTYFVILVTCGFTSYAQNESKPCDSGAVYINPDFFDNGCEYNLEKANCVIENGDYLIGSALLRKQLRECGREIEILVSLGNCYFKMDSVEKAEELFLEAYQMNKENPIVLYNLAVVAYSSQDYLTTVNFLEQAISYSKKSDGDMHYLLFDIYWELDSPVQAEKAIQRAIDINPENLEFHSRYAAFLMNYEKFGKGIEIIRKLQAEATPGTYFYYSLRELECLYLFEVEDQLEGCKCVEKLKEHESFVNSYKEMWNLHQCD